MLSRPRPVSAITWGNRSMRGVVIITASLVLSAAGRCERQVSVGRDAMDARFEPHRNCGTQHRNSGVLLVYINRSIGGSEDVLQVAL